MRLLARGSKCRFVYGEAGLAPVAHALPVVLAGDGAAEPVQRQGAELRRFAYCVDHPCLERGGSLVGTCAGDPFQCRGAVAEAGRAHRAAGAGQDAQADFGEAGLSVRRQHAVVRTQRDFQAAAQGVAVDDAGHRHRQFADGGKRALHAAAEFQQLLLRPLQHRPEHGDIGPGEEGVLGRTEQYAAQAGVRAEPFQCQVQFLQQARIELVDRLVFAVEPDFDDAVVECECLQALAGVEVRVHGALAVQAATDNGGWKVSPLRALVLSQPEGWKRGP